MNKYHQEILEEIKKVPKTNPKSTGWFNAGRYMGTTKLVYNITAPKIREIIKKWIKEHKDVSEEELMNVMDSFFKGESHTERNLGGKLLECLPKLTKQINPMCVDRWLIGAEGWGEVDSLCQSSFGAQTLLGKWDDWKNLLKKFAKDKDMVKRRAALVLLVKSVRESDDERLASLSFENIEKLKSEKDVLITKAISWLLRSLIVNHSQAVGNYLKENESSLPKIAVFETKRKLETGKK